MNKSTQTSNVEELKKYKELLETGVITESEFEQKKKELLTGMLLATGTTSEGKEKIMKIKKAVVTKFTQLREKGVFKRIAILLIVIVVIAIAVFFISSSVEKKNIEKRTAAIKDAISDTMNDYNLHRFDVEYNDSGIVDVYLKGYWSLTNGDALALIKELEFHDDINDPCGGEPLDIYTARIHPSNEKNEYYFRISSTNAYIREKILGNSVKPGLYYSVGERCVLEWEN